jgi:heme/copper-type cytochrome/quinol oxidase subunit 3
VYKRDRTGGLYGAIYTIILSVIFTCLQGIEYAVNEFTI